MGLCVIFKCCKILLFLDFILIKHKVSQNLGVKITRPRARVALISSSKFETGSKISKLN